MYCKQIICATVIIQINTKRIFESAHNHIPNFSQYLKLMKHSSFTWMLDVTKSAWFETAHLDIKGPQDCGNPSHYISCKNLMGKKTVTVPSINWSYKTADLLISGEN